MEHKGLALWAQWMSTLCILCVGSAATATATAIPNGHLNSEKMVTVVAPTPIRPVYSRTPYQGHYTSTPRVNAGDLSQPSSGRHRHGFFLSSPILYLLVHPNGWLVFDGWHSTVGSWLVSGLPLGQVLAFVFSGAPWCGGGVLYEFAHYGAAHRCCCCCHCCCHLF